MIIYQAKNKTNNKIYIGKTKYPLEKRKREHKIRAKYKNKKGIKNSYFYNAIIKYGFSNFNWEVIDTALTEQELTNKEIYHIAITSAYIDNTIGYNMTSGGDGNCLVGEANGMYNKKHTPEAIKSISDNAIGKYVGDKNPNFGNGDKIKGHKNPMHGKKGKEHPAYGRKHTPEELIKMSNNIKKPIMIDGKHYASVKDASEILNLTVGCITYRLRSKKFPNYTYINKDQ